MKIWSKTKIAATAIVAFISVVSAGSAYAADEVNFFRITKDTKTCAAPACGGVYATSMNTNEYTSKLANRFRGNEISSFDLSHLTLTPGQRRAFRRAVNSGQEVIIQVGMGQTVETENGTDVIEGVLGLLMPINTTSQASSSEPVQTTTPGNATTIRQTRNFRRAVNIDQKT